MLSFDVGLSDTKGKSSFSTTSGKCCMGKELISKSIKSYTRAKQQNIFWGGMAFSYNIVFMLNRRCKLSAPGHPTGVFVFLPTLLWLTKLSRSLIEFTCVLCSICGNKFIILAAFQLTLTQTILTNK